MLTTLANVLPAAVTTMPVDGLGALWGAIAASPGLAAVIVVLILNHKSEERREKTRQEGESLRQTSRQKHELAMAERYERLVGELEQDRRENLTVLRELVNDIRTSHTALFAANRNNAGQ